MGAVQLFFRNESCKDVTSKNIKEVDANARLRLSDVSLSMMQNDLQKTHLWKGPGMGGSSRVALEEPCGTGTLWAPLPLRKLKRQQVPSPFSKLQVASLAGWSELEPLFVGKLLNFSLS